MGDQPINTTWASNSDNSMTFTESEKALGIEYRGPIVSNQLNGIAEFTTEAIQWLQKSGGYFSSQKQYIINDVCSIVRYSPTKSLRIEHYKCVKVLDDYDYLIGIPPILGYETIQSDSSYVPIYYGGKVNTEYWEKISPEYGMNYVEQTVDGSEAYKLVYRILKFDPPASLGTEGSSNYGTTLKFKLINSSGLITTFYAEVKSTLAVVDDEVVYGNNGFGLPNFDVKISKVLSNITTDLFTEHIDDLMPYGARLELGYTTETVGSSTQKVYGLFLKPASDLSSFRVDIDYNDGITLESTLYTDSQDDSSITGGYYTTDIVMPIINGLESKINPEVGQIVDFLTDMTDELKFKKGLIYSGEGGITLTDSKLRVYSILSKSLGGVTSFQDLRFTMSVSKPDGQTTDDADIDSSASAGTVVSSEITNVAGLDSDTYENFQLNRLITSRYLRCY